MKTEPIEKIPFYAGLSGPEVEEKKEAFYEKLKSIDKAAVKTEGEWTPFYRVTTYTLPDGKIWVYYEDTEYGVPSSLERIA